MRTGILFLLLFAYCYCNAQVDVDTLTIKKKDINFMEDLLIPDDTSGGSVHLHGNLEILELLDLEKSVNKREYIFSGYRIQILSANSVTANIDSLQRYTERFEENFPEIPAYLQYFDPDFKIRVGNFKNRIEAVPTLKKIRQKYPRSYIVKTDISLKDLLPVQEEEIDEDENDITLPKEFPISDPPRLIFKD